MQKTRTYKSKSGAEYELKQVKEPAKRSKRSSSARKKTSGKRYDPEIGGWIDPPSKNPRVRRLMSKKPKPKAAAARKRKPAKAATRKGAVKRARKSTAKRAKRPATTRKKTAKQLSMW